MFFRRFGMRRAVGSSLFVTAQTPTTSSLLLTNLLVELDPRDVVTSSGNVATYLNLGGTLGVVTQSVAFNRAGWIANDSDFNNEPTAYHDNTVFASSSFYVLPDLSPYTECEVFAVIKPNNSYPDNPPPSVIYQGLYIIGSHLGAPLYNNLNGRILDGAGSTVRKDYGVAPQPLDVPHIYNVRSQDGEYTAYQSHATGSGVIYTTATNTAGLASLPRFGSAASAAWFNGSMAYFCVCGTVQTPLAREQFLSYLATRFALTYASNALTDEFGNFLTDEDGNLLTDES